jgi:toxin ParE1/3/4
MKRKAEVIWARTADRGVARIRSYLMARNPAALRALLSHVVDLAQKLEITPEMGVVCEDLEPVGDYRHVVLSPYRLIYSFTGHRVVILRLWDGRRDPADLALSGSTVEDD